jgi:hypothetical protein
MNLANTLGVNMHLTYLQLFYFLLISAVQTTLIQLDGRCTYFLICSHYSFGTYHLTITLCVLGYLNTCALKQYL